MSGRYMLARLTWVIGSRGNPAPLCFLLFLDSSFQSFATRQPASILRFPTAPLEGSNMPPKKRKDRPPRSPTPPRRASKRHAGRNASQPSTSAELDSEQNFSVDNLPVPPGTPAVHQLAIQQRTILRECETFNS